MLRNVKFIKLAGTKQLQPDLRAGAAQYKPLIIHVHLLILALKRQVQELI